MSARGTVEGTQDILSHTTEAKDVSSVFQARKRMYALTLEKQAYNEWRKIDLYMRKNKQPRYTLICEHDGPEYPHIHCLYQYDAPKKINSQFLLGAHIETHVWSPQKYVEYCKALDEKHKSLGVHAEILCEEGELSKAGGRTIREVKQMTKEQRDELPIQYYHIVKDINKRESNDIDIDDWDKDIKIIWFWGMSGSGKSTAAKQYVRTNPEYGRLINVISYVNSFYQGIGNNAKIAIYDDFRDSDMKAAEFVKLIDYRKHTLNIKGDEIINNYKLIIFTSLQNPKNIYRSYMEEDRIQWLRRMEVIHIPGTDEWGKMARYMLWLDECADD